MPRGDYQHSITQLTGSIGGLVDDIHSLISQIGGEFRKDIIRLALRKVLADVDVSPTFQHKAKGATLAQQRARQRESARASLLRRAAK